MTLLSRLKVAGGNRTAPYSQIEQTLRRHIAEGGLHPGDRLPAVREMARASGVSPFTVGRALNELAREGLIVTHSGSGTFVAQSSVMTVEILIATEPGAYPPEDPFYRAYFQQIADGLQPAGEGSAVRCFFSFMHSGHARSEEIIGVCRARRANALLVYRPIGRVAQELAAVAEQVPTISLMYPISHVAAHCVTVDPSPALERLLRQRLSNGQRSFCYAGIQSNDDEMTEKHSPYARIHRTFMAVMAEAHILPVALFGSRFGSLGDEEVAAQARPIPEGATLVAAYPRMAEAIGRARPGLDAISYTECRTTLKEFRSRQTILYGGLEKCAVLVRSFLGQPRPESEQIHFVKADVADRSE